LGLPSGTARETLGDRGWCHRMGITTPAGFNKYSKEVQEKELDFEKALNRDDQAPLFGIMSELYPSGNAFLAALVGSSFEELDVSTALPLDSFDHLGQDCAHLLAMLKSDRPMRVAIVGASGTGKSALVAAALKASGRIGLMRLRRSPYEDERTSNATWGHFVQTARSCAEPMGHRVVLIDQDASKWIGQHLKNGAYLLGTRVDERSDALSNPSEIWVIDSAFPIPAEILGSFDIIVRVPACPYNKRLALAGQLFPIPRYKSDIASSVAKTCATVGDISRLARWSQSTDQNTWSELALIAHTMAQTSLGAGGKDGEKALPITLYQPCDNLKGFGDFIGADGALAQARRVIAGYQDPDRFARLGATPARGVLLIGNPGTGKTYLARAMAHEAGVTLLVASSSALGQEPELITAVFAEARRQAPCILFLDEIDAVGARAVKFDGSSESPERQAILNRLLTEISGVEDLTGVLVIGATHRPRTLDEALTRSGRLRCTITMALPDRDERKALWQYYTKTMPLSSDVDWDRVARMSSGMSPADIAEAANEAATTAALKDSVQVSISDFVSAVDHVAFGVVPSLKSHKESEVFKTAVHEAGHALIAWATSEDIERVSVHPGVVALGYVRMLPDEDRLGLHRQDLDNKLMVMFGGLVAEECILGDRSTGSSGDLDAIRGVLERIVRVEGMGSRALGMDYFASAGTKALVEEEERVLADRAKARAHALLGSLSEDITALAKYLVGLREISGIEMNAWCQSRGLDRPRLLALAGSSNSAQNVGLPPQDCGRTEHQAVSSSSVVTPHPINDDLRAAAQVRDTST
jgi:cell division protease FtsH